MRKWMGVLGAMLLAMQGFGDVIYNASFENEPVVESGNPSGWTIFGTPLDDRGTMQNSQYHSPTAAVWAAFTWSGWGWGATTVSNEGVRYNIFNDDATIGAWMRATNDFSAASISFTLFDADGTQLRADGTNMFSLTSSWASYQTRVGGMITETAGNIPGLDTSNITHFGFLAFTSGQTGQNLMQFDDFTIQAIPEPATATALLIGLGIVFSRLRKQRK
jgi:hypothetical protein